MLTVVVNVEKRLDEIACSQFYNKFVTDAVALVATTTENLAHNRGDEQQYQHGPLV